MPLEEKPLGGGGYNLDALGDDAFGGGVAVLNDKPKRAPPARLAKKDQEEEKGDVTMKDEEVKKPTPKAPPKAAPKTTGKAPGKGSSAVAPPTNDDDLGVGMSKEEADAMV